MRKSLYNILAIRTKYKKEDGRTEKMENEIQEFIAYLHDEKHISENTEIAYQRDLKKFMSFLEKRRITDVKNVTVTNVNSYMLSLEKKGRAASSISRNIASIRMFYDFLVKQGKVKENPAEHVKGPKVKRKFPEILTLEETDLLLSQPNKDNAKEIRDKAMLELLYATGIRVSELIALKRSDVNLKLSYITCRDQEKERIVPFGLKAKAALVSYIENARNEIIKDRKIDILFTNCTGNPMSRQGFWKIMKYYGKKAGIKKEITPHTLRHSFASHLVGNGADLHIVQEMLGHADISTTYRYVEMKNMQIREAYKKAHPRNEL